MILNPVDPFCRQSLSNLTEFRYHSLHCLQVEVMLKLSLAGCLLSLSSCSSNEQHSFQYLKKPEGQPLAKQRPGQLDGYSILSFINPLCPVWVNPQSQLSCGCLCPPALTAKSLADVACQRQAQSGSSAMLCKGCPPQRRQLLPFPPCQQGTKGEVWTRSLYDCQLCLHSMSGKLLIK